VGLCVGFRVGALVGVFMICNSHVETPGVSEMQTGIVMASSSINAILTDVGVRVCALVGA
jgi:hypothetical protein